MLVGFLTGVGVQVSLGEITRLLGIPSAGNNLATRLMDSVQHIGEANVMSLSIGLTVIVIIVALKKLSKKTPGALIAVIGAVVASWSVPRCFHCGVRPRWSTEARSARRAFDLEPCVEATSTGVLNLRGDFGPKCSHFQGFRCSPQRAFQ